MAVEKIEITQTFYINKNWSESTDLSAETIVVNGVAVEASTLQWGVNAFADVASAQAATGYTAGGTLLVFAGSGNTTTFTSDAVIATADGISAVITEDTTTGSVNLVVMEGSKFYAGGSSPVGFWSGTDGKTTLDVAGYYEVGQLNIQAGSTVNVTAGGKVKSTGAGDVTIIGGHLVAVGDGTWDKELIEIASTNLSPDMGGATDEQKEDFDASISVKDAAMIVNGSILYGRTEAWPAYDALYENNEYTVTLDNAKLTMNAIANGNAKDNKQENYMINPALILGASEKIYYEKLGYISYGGTKSATDTSIVIGYKNPQNIVGDAVLTVKNGSEVYTDAIIGGATAKIDISGGSKVFIKDFYMAGAESVTVNGKEYSLAGGTAQIARDSNLTITNSFELEEGTTFTQDYTSTVITKSITVAEGASFEIDLTGIGGEGTDWSKVYVVLKADAVTGNITVKDKPADTAYTYEEKAIGETGKVIYAYDAEQLDKNSICVTSGSYTEGDLVWANETGYIYGTTAFNDLQAAFDMASANGADVVTEICIDGTVGDANKTFKIGSENESGTGRHVSFVGEGTINAQHFNHDGGHGSTFDIGEDVTIRIDNPSSESAQFQLTGNTVNVYGKITQGDNVVYSFFRVKGSETKAKLNVKAGSLVDLNQMSVNAGVSYEINVEGNGTAVDKTTGLQFGKWAPQKMLFGGAEITVSDYGYLSFDSEASAIGIGTAKNAGDSVGFLKLDTGYLDVKSSAVITIDKNSSFEAVNNSVANIASLTVNGSAKIDATSALTYTGAITVAEGASFTVDFTGFEAAENQLFALIVDGSASTGGITGNVTFTGLAEDSTWKAVSGSGSIYAYDSSKVSSTANLVVDADWADDGLAFGATAMTDENGVKYLWGINAFSNLNDAIAAGAGNDAITITNANKSAYDFGGSNAVIGMDGLNWTLKGDWTNAAGIDVLGNLTITEGTVTSTSGTVTGNITVVGNGALNEKNYGISNQDNTLNLVITDATDAAVPLLKKNHGAGEYYKNTIINISAEDGTELKDSYKVIGFSPDNYGAGAVNYIVNFQPATTLNMDSALAKGGYNMVATYDGLYITKKSYDMSEIRVNAAWAEMADGTEVTGLDGKTYVIGINAYGDANHAVNAALVNCDAENQITVRFESDFTSVNELDFRYNSEMNIVLAGGKITEEVDGETVTRNVLLHTQGNGNSFDTWGSTGDLIIAEDLTVKTQDLSDGDNIRLYDDLHVYGEFHTHQLNRGSLDTSVTVYKTGTMTISYWMYQNTPNITVYGNGESFRETAQFHASTAGANIDINMVDNNNEFNMNISDYGFVQIGTYNSSSTIGTTNVAEKYNINLADGKLYYYGGVTFGKVDGGEGAAVNLTLTGNSLFEQGHSDCTVTFTAAANADIAYTSRVDYGGAIEIHEGANFAINFSDFSLETMGDDKFAVIVDGRDAKNGITGDVNYVGLSKLENLDWAVMNDGKNVYIYDEVFYGTDIYVNTDWAAMGSLTEVPDSNYVIGLNAFGSIDKAVAAGKNTVISLNVLGNGDYSAANISFAVEDEVVVNADGAFKADSITAAGKAVTADQMDIVSGSGNVSRAGTLNLGDGKDDDAALTLADGETLILSQMNVTENATIYGDGVRFSGKGATLTIADGKTLTMSLEQLLAIQGVEIVGAEGSVIVTGLKGITASQKAELIEEYGTIIKDLNDTVAEADPITDVADLTEIDEGYVGDVGGTQGADKLVIGKGEAADYSGIDYNMRGGKNVATINADADFAIGDLTNVGTVDVKAGSKTGVTKATFGDITTSAGAGTVKVGNNAEFSADSIKASNLGGTNTVSFGNNVKGTVNGNVTELKSLALGNGSTLNVSGNISSDNTTFASAALKVGNDSTITADDVTMNSVTLGKNVIADLGGIYTAKAVTIGANNTVSIDSVDGVAANGAIKAGNDSVVEIAADVNMRGGKNSIVTGKSSDWTIGSDVMNVNTLTVTAAGNWAWNVAKTAYTLQRTTLNIGGDFLAGEGAAVLNFGNYSIVEIGGGILESDLGSSFKITVGSNAEVAVGDMIQSLNSLTIGNGVDYKTYSLNEAGKAVADADKEEGTTVFSAGKVTGTAGNDTIKIGNKAEVTMGKVSLGAGNDTINIGKDSTFEAADVALGAGKNTVVIGANSWMNVDDISGVNKLTATGNLIAGDITGTDDFADVVTFNGNAEIGSIDLGTDAKGKMSDKLVIGKGAEVVINGGISNVEALTIGAGAKVSASESTIAAMKELGSAKGSKIDASVEFVALDDAAGDTTSTASFEAGFEALLGAKIDGGDGLIVDEADCFALGTGTDLTGWEIEGAGIKVTVFKQTAEGWDNGTVIEDAVGEGAVADGKFTLGDYTAEGVTGVKVAVSFESENTEITKYNVTKLA